MSRTIRGVTVGAAIAVAVALAMPTTAGAQTLSPTISVGVVAAPTATAQSVAAVENVTKAITLTGTVDSTKTKSFKIETNPLKGTLTGFNAATGAVNYLPNRDVADTTDSFTFRTYDGTTYSAPATVSITIAKGNSYPVAPSFDVTVGQDQNAGIVFNGSDPDAGTVLSYDITKAPTHGTIGNGVGERIYKPNAGYVGGDSFQYSVSDGTLTSYGTVTITVTPALPPVLPPGAQGQSLKTDKNVALPIVLGGTGSGTLAYETRVKPTHGDLSGYGKNLVYTPDKDFVGNDFFTYVVSNGTKESAPATIAITVNNPYVPPVNRAPLAKNVVVTTVQNKDVYLKLLGSDPDGDAITYAYNQPKHGDVTGTAPDLTYSPDKWFRGYDSFTYTVSDGKLTTTGTVTIVVRGFQHRPVAYDQSLTTGVRHPVRINLNGWSGDRDDLDYFVIDGPNHGRLIKVDDNTVIYVPNRHFKGTDSFDFIVRDEDGNRSRPATVTIKVKPYWGGHYFH